MAADGAGVWIFEEKSNIRTHTNRKNIISGRVSTVEITSYNPNPMVIGEQSEVILNKVDTAGPMILGGNSRVHNLVEEGRGDNIIRTDGVLILGTKSSVWDVTKSWKEIEGDVRDTDINAEGTIITGMGCAISTPINAGMLVIGGYSTVSSAYNVGVIIEGTAGIQSRFFWNDKGVSLGTNEEGYIRREENVTGPGIFIRGIGLEYGKEKTPRHPSLIQVSTEQNEKTILKGSLQLDENCNIFTKSGKQLIKNGELMTS